MAVYRVLSSDINDIVKETDYEFAYLTNYNIKYYIVVDLFYVGKPYTEWEMPIIYRKIAEWKDDDNA